MRAAVMRWKARKQFDMFAHTDARVAELADAQDLGRNT
jgi:hypothetical protein